MNCEYHVGLLVYGGHGAALRVRPEKPVPIDQFPVWFESRIDSQGVADHTSITPCAKSNCYPRGVFVVPKGVLPDGSHVFG